MPDPVVKAPKAPKDQLNAAGEPMRMNKYGPVRERRLALGDEETVDFARDLSGTYGNYVDPQEVTADGDTFPGAPSWMDRTQEQRSRRDARAADPRSQRSAEDAQLAGQRGAEASSESSSPVVRALLGLIRGN